MADADHFELEAWKPTGITPLGAPRDLPTEDLRFRPARGPAEVPQDKRDRARKAVADQCLNSRVPGYTGFIPSAKAEDIYGRTQAHVGRGSHVEQHKQHTRREQATTDALQMLQSGQHASKPSSPVVNDFTAPAPDPHPLGKSQAALIRNHWVPTIPGYGGYIPAKHAENITGGGIMHTCKMAGRAIAERPPPLESFAAVTREDDLQRGRIVEHFHEENRAEQPEYQAKHAGRLRDHLERQIPGYMGHIPRKFGESLYGARAKEINKIAADMMEDRIYRPENHINMCAAPQAPTARKLRL